MGFPNLFREPLLHILLEEATRIDLWGSPLLIYFFCIVRTGAPYGVIYQCMHNCALSMAYYHYARNFGPEEQFGSRMLPVRKIGLRLL